MQQRWGGERGASHPIALNAFCVVLEDIKLLFAKTDHIHLVLQVFLIIIGVFVLSEINTYCLNNETAYK